MITLISFLLGMTVAGLRSVIAFATVSFLILAAFGTAALIHGAAAPLLSLVMAIVGYNLGIGGAMAAVGFYLHLARPAKG